MVHARLNPDVPVIVAPVRAEGIRDARAKGCDVVVLDDAFQHRRIARHADWVLVSADRWTGSVVRLPAGPWREPMSALRRATIAVVTRKAASAALAREVRDRIGVAAPGTPTVVIALEPDALRTPDGMVSRALDSLAGASILLVSGIGDPQALRRQLERTGANVRERAFADHHAFSASEISELAGSLRADEIVVCTLKDAVKLAPRWPRAAPSLWYVSQRVNVEEGVDRLEESLDALLHARSQAPDAVRSRGPYL
jgi:tetraacyldisaccharide 4'-kinase